MKLPNITKEREAKGLSKYKTAKLLGCVSSTYDRWENRPELFPLGKYCEFTELETLATSDTHPQVEVSAQPEPHSVENDTIEIRPIQAEAPSTLVELHPFDESVLSALPGPIDAFPADETPVPTEKDDASVFTRLDEKSQPDENTRPSSASIDRLHDAIAALPPRDAWDTVREFAKNFDLSREHLPWLLNKVFWNEVPAYFAEKL